MTIKAHFDGKVIVPDEPVNLPKDQQLEISILPVANDDRPYMTGAELARYIQEHPEISEYWEQLAAGRDSTEVARELREEAERRGARHDLG